MAEDEVLDVDDLELPNVTAIPVRDDEDLLAIGMADNSPTGRPTMRCGEITRW